MYRKKMTKIALVMLILSLGILVGLIFLIRYHNVLQVDIFLSRDLQSEGDTVGKRDFLYRFFVFVSFFGRTLVAAVMIVLTAAIFWLYGMYRETVFILLTPISSALDWLVKLLVNRPRPSDTLVRVLDRQMSASFPSGHTVFYTVFFGFLLALAFYKKKINLTLRIIIGFISVFFIVTVSYSRMYLGAHWASDIAGGYLLGLACLIVLVYYYLQDSQSS